MERLTYNFAVGEIHCWQVHGADNLMCEEVCSQYSEKSCKECPIGKAIDRLAHYEDLEEQGRLVVLPCKVGDTVYYTAFGKVYEGKCHAITVHQSGVQVHLYDFDGDNASYSEKSVFRSRPEAEAALAASGKEV